MPVSNNSNRQNNRPSKSRPQSFTIPSSKASIAMVSVSIGGSRRTLEALKGMVPVTVSMLPPTGLPLGRGFITRLLVSRKVLFASLLLGRVVLPQLAFCFLVKFADLVVICSTVEAVIEWCKVVHVRHVK